jgi:hypothetical protein
MCGVVCERVDAHTYTLLREVGSREQPIPSPVGSWVERVRWCLWYVRPLPSSPLYTFRPLCGKDVTLSS